MVKSKIETHFLIHKGQGNQSILLYAKPFPVKAWQMRFSNTQFGKKKKKLKFFLNKMSDK